MGTVRTHAREARPPATERDPVAPMVVGSAHDRAEVQADHVAAQVLRFLDGARSAPAVPSRGGGGTDDVPARRRADATPGSPIGPQGGELDASVTAAIERERGGGAPLATTVRRPMEAAFGTDLSRVRLHTGGRAAKLNRSLSARAFTIGQDVFFGPGEYRPSSHAGRHLLAHELAHTVQQGTTGRRAARTVRRWAVLHRPGAPLDLNDAVSIEAVSSGQKVFFLTDENDEKLVVKAEIAPLGLAQIARVIHWDTARLKSPSFRPLPDTDRLKLKRLIASGAAANKSWDALYQSQKKTVDAIALSARQGTDAKALANLALMEPYDLDLPRPKARLYHIDRLDRVKRLVAMTVAEGETAEALSAPGRETRLRTLMSDRTHVEKLGEMTAADCFMSNSDRVTSSNLGNWMIDHKDQITVIDNIDNLGIMTFKSGELDSELMLLAKARLPFTARNAINSLLEGMVQSGDVQAKQWADTPIHGLTMRTNMERAFERGLRAGKARIVKLYGFRWFSTKESRRLKPHAQQNYRDDVARGESAPKNYYDIIRSRARWLKTH